MHRCCHRFIQRERSAEECDVWMYDSYLICATGVNDDSVRGYCYSETEKPSFEKCEVLLQV